MKQINLLKHKGKKAMTLKDFKKWLNKLVVDKKGALPDLADWKLIKENLDKVKPDVIDTSGYSIMKPSYASKVASGEYRQSVISPGVSIHETTNDVWLPDVVNPAQYLGYDMKLFDDLEYFLNKAEELTAVPEWYYDPLSMHAIETTYNGTKINLDNANEYKAEEIESILNRGCSGK